MAKPLIPAEEILDRTLRLLDAQGPAVLTVRRISGELGISPNTLYQQVGNQAALTRAVVARHFARLTLDFTEHDTWEATALHWCLALREALRAHPFLTELMTIEDRDTIRDYADALFRSTVRSGIPAPLAMECCRGLTNLTINHAVAEVKSARAPSAAMAAELKKVDRTFGRLVGWVITAVRAEAAAE